MVQIKSQGMLQLRGKFFLTAMLSILLYNGKSQQLPMYTQYMFNEYILNPAVAGAKEYDVLRTSYRNQWTGFDGTPITQTLSAHFRATKKTGIGFAFFTDKTGTFSNNGLQMSYAYHLPINRNHNVAFGLSALLTYFQYDGTEIILLNPGDPEMPPTVDKSIMPDASFGVYFYGEYYYAGFSIPHLIQSRMTFDSNGDVFDSRLVRHYYLMGGISLNSSSNNVKFEPSMLIKFTEYTLPQFELGLKFKTGKNIWIGSTCRLGESVAAMLGFEIKGVFIGYNYDYPFLNLRDFSKTSHEIVVGYNLERRGKRKYF